MQLPVPALHQPVPPAHPPPYQPGNRRRPQPYPPPHGPTPVKLPYLPSAQRPPYVPYTPSSRYGGGSQAGAHEQQPASQLRVVRHGAPGRSSVAVYNRAAVPSSRQRHAQHQLPEYNPITHQRNYPRAAAPPHYNYYQQQQPRYVPQVLPNWR